MCRPRVAGYGTWNVPTTFQSECHWASALRFTQGGLTPKNRGADATPLRCLITDRSSGYPPPTIHHPLNQTDS